VFVSPAKTAPVYTPWPADVLPRSRVHVSIVAHVAAAHYCEHVPFHRLEQQLARTGVVLPRVTQVSLMNQLNERLGPLVVAMKLDVLQSDYVMLDATPVPVCDPQRPGTTREATLWAYRNGAGTVWFDYQASKSPQHPDRVLKAAQFCGLLQTDGASGLGDIGPAGKVVSLGCFAHLRRYVFEAWESGERNATPYLETINRLFRLDRLAQHFGLTVENKSELRRRHSLPLFERLITRAREEASTVAPRTGMGKALHYLSGQEKRLRQTLQEARAELSTNRVENTIRPLKLGVRNWLQVGHPEAGPRLANLFTVVENCRQLALDPEAYLIDVITRLPDHPAARVAELLPRAWQTSRAAATRIAAAPG
jgi:transposase